MTLLTTREDAEYAYTLIKKICNEIGPGCPGSPQERARAMMIKEELGKVTDNVVMEDFSFAPNAFLGWFSVNAVCTIIAAGCFYLSLVNITSLVFAILAFCIAIFIFLIMEFEFIYSREFLDFLYKKRKSTNVIGTIQPKEGGSPERILIYSGHHDSALQFTWFRYFKSGFFVVVSIIVFNVFILLICTAVRLVSLIFSLQDSWNVSLFTFLICSFFPAGVIFSIFFTERSKKGGRVPGAVDNLSGASLAVAVANVLKANPEIQPPRTEVRIISFGAEEASIRGSRSYVRRHLAELKTYDAVCINFESIAQREIIIYKSDLNNSLKFDNETVAAVTNAAITTDVPHTVKPFPFGGAATDAASFCKAGLKAISLSAMKFPEMLAFYHQEFDTPDKIDLIALQNALQIAIQYMIKFNC